MKSKMLKRIEVSTAALMLIFLIGCGNHTGDGSKTTDTNAVAAEFAAAAADSAAANPKPAKQQQPTHPRAPASKPAETATTAPSGRVRYEAQTSGSNMKIEGTSTIHDWSMESAVLGGYLEADAKFPNSTDSATKPEAYVFMPVRSFKSYNKRMDEVMQEHMKEPQFKRIEYHLTELKPKSAAGTTGAVEFDATGTLAVAGKTNTITMPVTVEKIEGPKLKVTGSIVMKMTDFGVEPPAPSIGLGLIKTGDSITNSFVWMLAPKAP